MDYNPPNTRQRIAARRLARQGRTPTSGSQVRPNLQRAMLSGLQNGRLASLMIFVVCISMLGYMFSSADYNIQHVTVEGLNALKLEQVISEAGIQGRPIWFVGTGEIEARLRENPYVESVHVQLVIPDRANIQISERRPEVRWQVGNVQYLVDSRGQVLAAAQEPATGDVLIVIDRSTQELKPGDRIDTDALSLTRTLALRLPQELAFNPVQIGWDFGVGVYVQSANGETIIFGQNKELDRKLAILGKLLQDKTPFTYLDLRSSSPFYQNHQAPGNEQPQP